MPIITGRHDGRRLLLDVALVNATFSQASSFEHVDPSAAVFSEPVTALIDTGASSTSVAPAVARRLGLRPTGKCDVMTANGVRRAKTYHFRIAVLAPPQSELGGFFALPNPITGTELNSDGFTFDILLGMDAVSQGDLVIRRNGEFSFEV